MPTFSQKNSAWTLSQKELFINFETSAKGLTKKQVEKKRAEYGMNEIAQKEGKRGLVIFLEQLTNPLVIVLIFATAIAFFLGEKADAIIIVAIVLINAVLGFTQEYRAEKTVRALRKLISQKAKVLRDGKKIELDAKLLVPGDFVYLGIGDIVPADVRLLAQEEITIDEASLTGESVPVSKSVDIVKTTNALPQNLKNMAFMGTHVMSGNAYGIVTSTGSKTFFGKTAAYLQEPETASDFEKSIGSFSRFLLKMILVMTVFIFIINTVLHHGLLESFLFALALAVGITPEALPVIITISLSKAAQNLAKVKVIIKKLSSIEDLGNMDVLCTDKTGTLTEGNLALFDFLTADGVQDQQLLIYGLLCNDAVVTGKKVEGNIIDRAIWESDQKKTVQGLLKKYSVLDHNEFDFERRRMSVVIKTPDDKRYLVVKGGVESLAHIATKIMVDGKVVDCTAAEREAHLKMINSYRQKGYSTISIAVKEWNGDKSTKTDEKDLILAGFLLFMDPPRKSAKSSLLQLKNLGVQVKVLSGDDPLVTRCICEKVGFTIHDGVILTGEDLDKMDEKAFRAAIEKYNVFSRITPDHKYRIVKTLNTGSERTVAFMGDGINDAPAIKVADVGISVDTATDIAKEAADIILLQQNLGVIAAGITEGRKIFSNITKYILNTVSANFGNMFTVAGSSLFLNFIPLLPSQILLNNLLTDTPMLAIASDNVNPDNLKKPKKLDLAMIRSFMTYFGLLSTFFDMALILTILFVFRATPELFRTAWFFESGMSELLITFSIRTQKPFFKDKPGKLLFWFSVLTALLLIAFVYTPLAGWFEFTQLNTTMLLFIFGIIGLYFVASELVKKFFFQKFRF